MARPATTMPGNAARVLRIVHEGGPLPRAELTRRTGLNRSTVLAIVGELVEQGLVHEESPAPGGPGADRPTAGVGRPSAIVRASPDVVAAAVTVEIDAVGVALVALDGTVRDPLVEPQPSVPSAAVAIDAVARVLGTLTTRAAPGLRLVGVGVAVPGIVRVEDGGVRDAPPIASACPSAPRTTRTSAPGPNGCTAAPAASTTWSTSTAARAASAAASSAPADRSAAPTGTRASSGTPSSPRTASAATAGPSGAWRPRPRASP